MALFQTITQGSLLYRKIPFAAVIWIFHQYQNGIEVSLLRASDLDEDRSLICDFGIYGERAVGYQSTDETGRTTRYELHFDATSIQLAEQRWKQLQLYAIPLEKLLDQANSAR